MKYRGLIIILSLAVFLASCDVFFVEERGNGDIVVEEWNLSQFDEIDLLGNYDVELIPSDEFRIEVETDENLFEFIEVDVRGGVLSVESTRRIEASEGIFVKVYFEELEGIMAGGAAKITSSETIFIRRFEVQMSGAGLIDLDIEGGELEVGISGAGSVRLAGNVRDLQVSMSGAGELKAYDLKTEYCRVEISGVGGAEVFVTEELEAQVSGVGGVTYIGDPEHVRKNVSGLGNVEKGRDKRDL